MLNINISHLFIPDTNYPLLSNIRYQFTNGWTGIVGRNGSGKTTLAKAIAGIYFNYIGTITGNDDIYYLDQLDSKNEEELYEFLCDTSAEAGFWKSQLQIGWNHLENWEDLSFGERRRSQIALALYTRPRVIILDEPTNH
jgi:ATPase subunit of ABC transporter with duplicated ATPase domains